MRIVQQRLKGRRHRDVVTEDGEIGQTFARGLLDRQRGRGRRGLKPEAKEHDLPIGVTPRQFKRVQR